MCLQTVWKNPKVAEFDITVFKIGSCNEDKTVFFSLYYEFNYEIGKLYQTSMKTTTDTTGFDERANERKRHFRLIGISFRSIGEGFHSATHKKRLVETDDDLEANEVIAECTIPKGGYYYEDQDGLVVSDRIIINKIL